MLKRLEAIRRYISGCLAAAARAYWAPTLAAYHADPRADDARSQAVIGNLLCGCEASVKAALASIHPSLVLKDPPLEARCFLAAPEALPDDFHLEPYELDLKDFTHDLISWKQAVRMYGVFFQEQKRLLRPYFKLATDLHPLSLHASLGRVREGETEKMVYLALQLARSARERAGEAAYEWTAADRRFIETFESARVKKVAERMDKAAKKAATLKVDITYNDPDARASWDEFETRCPVCKNWAVLSGWTQMICGPAGGKETLGFYADTFDCDACGLFLDDSEELRLGGLPLFHDRGEDLARWRSDPPAKEKEEDS